MRVIVIAMVALSVGCGLLIENQSWASQQTDRASRRFTISKQGTLLELIGTDRKGSRKVTGDGFELNYKTQGQSRSAFATEMKTKGLRTSSEPPKYDGNKATAVVQTADRSLEITSEFTFDAEAGELIIKRKFRNTSKYPVTLQGVRNYIDPIFMAGDQFNQSATLLSPPSIPIAAYLAHNVGDCGPGKCPVPPDCPACPPVTMPNPNLNHKYLIPSTRFELNWPEQIILMPQRPQRPQKPGSEVSIAIRVSMK